MSLEAVVKVEDVIRKFGFSKNTAIKFMKSAELHSYRLGTPYYCSRANFDTYINYLIDVGNETYGGGIRTKRKELINTLEPVVKARDVMDTYGVCKGSALKIMTHKSLCSYRPTGSMLVCERQYFREFVNTLELTGGVTSLDYLKMSCMDSFQIPIQMSIWCFLEAVCTDEEFERIKKYGIRKINI